MPIEHVDGEGDPTVTKETKEKEGETKKGEGDVNSGKKEVDGDKKEAEKKHEDWEDDLD